MLSLFFFFVKDRHNEDALSIGEGGGTKDININHSFFFFFLFVMEQKDGPQNVQALFMSDQSLQSIEGKVSVFQKGIEDDNLRFF